MPFLAGLLLYCSSSSAYDQQYNVGDTGPNGGTVTGVTVVPALTNTQEEMVGDFLETTYTYTYTETIVETVNQTSYETVTVVKEETNQLINTGIVTDTNVSTSCYDANIEVCTGNQQTGGGSRTYDINVSNYDNKKEIDYGATVYSHQSNTTLPTCSNTTGDCQDEFKITVRLYDDGVLQNTYTHNYSSINWQGSQDYSFSQDVRSLTFNSAELELYGMDAGYYQGYYGPGFSDVFFNLTYDYITEVINQVITQAEMITIKQTTEYEYDSQYIPPPIEVDYTDYTADAGMTFELELDTFDGGMANFEVEVTDTPTGDFEIKITEVESFDSEPQQVAQIEEREPDGESNQQQNVVQETEAPKSTNTPNESASNEKGDGEQKSVSQERTKGDGGSKSSNSQTAAYSTVMESVRIAVMQQSDAVRSFNEYQQITLADNQFYPPYELDGGKTYDNPYADYYTGAADYLWNEMVDMQWQN